MAYINLDELAGLSIVRTHVCFPPAADESIDYHDWAPSTCELLAVRAMMVTLPTSGPATYILTVDKYPGAPGVSLLSTPTFDLDSLAAPNVPELIPLTGVPADLQFATGERYRINISSTPAFTGGSGVYIEVLLRLV